MVTPFTADLITVRSWEGMTIATAAGLLGGRMPEPKPKPEVHRVAIAPHHRTGRGALSDCGWLPVSGHVFIDETKQRGDSRKHAIASAIIVTDIQVTVYDAARRYRNERERRAACLRAAVNDAAARAHPVLVLEQDDSLFGWDNRHLIEFTRAAGCRDTLRYQHRRATKEHLLAIPDAIAWCWAKGGDWRRRIQPGVTDLREV